MRRGTTRAGLIAASAALIGAAACSRTSPVDSGLKQDLAAAAPSSLELAPQATKAQVTVSAIEAGPESAPKAAAPRKVTRPTTRRAPHIASPKQVAQALAAAPVPQPQIIAQTAPSPAPKAAPTPAPAQEPAPIAKPVQPQGRQPGVYATEGQVFAKMPWIRP